SYFFFSSRRRHTRSKRDWSSDVCSSDLDPRLHLDERLTPREAEAARMALHDLPLGLAAESPQRSARPGTDIEFGELPLDADGARSEERRVGKECRSRRGAEHYKEKEDM